MYLFNGVTIDGDDSAKYLHRSTSASMPSMHLSASVRVALDSSRMDSSRLQPMTGNITLSSKLPCEPANATVASLPMPCAATIRVASGSTGFTLPGMIDEPGCRSGRRISDSPARGPEPIHLMSLQILVRLTAITRSLPEVSTSASLEPL